MAIGDALISAECDKCGEVTDQMNLTTLAGGGWDARGITDKLRRMGWTVDGDTTICPECKTEVPHAHLR